MGKNFTPIEAADINQHLSGTELVELKIDGTMMTWDGTKFVSNRGVERSDRYSHITQELDQIDALVEGEVAIPADAGMLPHVLNLNKKENWHKARFYLFGVHEIKGKDVRDADPHEARRIIDDLLSQRWSHLRSCRLFKDFKTGWDFVERQVTRGGYAEGLVVKGSTKTWKIKKLTEAKLPIVGFEDGSLKGAFLIAMPNGEVGKVSGTSVGFVQQYRQHLADNEKPYVEIEYQFLTDRGVPFQPRLRRMGTLADLNS